MSMRVPWLCVIALWTSSVVWARPSRGETGAAAAAPSEAAKVVAADAAKKDDKSKSPFPKFEEVTKDMEAQKGLFTLWAYPKGATNKDPEKLLCQVPSGFLGKQFVISVGFSGGGGFTSMQLDQYVVKWERMNKKLLLIEPQSGYVVDDSKTVSDVVERTHPEMIRAAVPIVTLSSGGDPVIDLGGLLKGDFADIGWMSFGGASISSDLSTWTEKKAFELNVEIGVALAVHRSSPPGSFDKKLVHFSFWKLPESDYKPRIADDRVGYFLTANRDWSKPVDARDIFNRYIDRWQLEKRDASLPMCEPKQPIVFYLEKTIPVQYRRAVRDGVLEWNKAFEKIGLVNAIEVRQQTKDNEWKDLDPEDMRYSFIRWIVTGSPFAMAMSRANPFTGQVYEASVVIDDSFARAFEAEGSDNLPEEAMASKLADPSLRAFFDAHPEWEPPQRPWQTTADKQTRAQTRRREHMQDLLERDARTSCHYAEGMQHQLAVAYAATIGLPKEVMNRLLYDVIKETVMHEVGHTLGLRHNFMGSTIHSVEEVKSLRMTDQPLVGSVMDYNPILLFSGKMDKGHFTTPTVGPYDDWAIEYGYRVADGTYHAHGKDDSTMSDSNKKEGNAKAQPANGKTETVSPEVLAKLPESIRKMVEEKLKAEGASSTEADAASKPPTIPGAGMSEKDMLADIASRAAEPQLVYATDEDTTLLSPDPRSNRFDMGSSPIDWAKERLEVLDERIATLLKWSVKDKESWYHARTAFNALVFDKVLLFDYVGRYIGGQYTNRSHRGDPNAEPPLKVVDADTQRRALDFIAENLYSDKIFSFSPELLNHLPTPRWSHRGVWTDYVIDYPEHQTIDFLQWWNLVDRFMPNTFRRIQDAELKSTEANKLTLAEYVQRLQRSCWREVLDHKPGDQDAWSDTKPFLSSTRRSLQREYLVLMEQLLQYRPGMLLSPDIHAMLCHALRRLDASIQLTVGTGKLDFASQAHLEDCQSRIKRILKPQFQEVGL